MSQSKNRATVECKFYRKFGSCRKRDRCLFSHYPVDRKNFEVPDPFLCFPPPPPPPPLKRWIPRKAPVESWRKSLSSFPTSQRNKEVRKYSPQSQRRSNQEKCFQKQSEIFSDKRREEESLGTKQRRSRK